MGNLAMKIGLGLAVGIGAASYIGSMFRGNAGNQLNKALNNNNNNAQDAFVPRR